MDRSLLAEKVYTDPSNPGSFGGQDRLYRQLKKYGFTRQDVSNFLKLQDVYTLHKDRRIKFPRNRVFAYSKDFQWMADLVDLSKYSRQNHGYKYILVVIDVFTKYLWARCLKTKQPLEMKRAWESIFEDDRKPLRLQTDRGGEFDSAYMKQYYKEKNITYFTSWNPTFKCSVVERVNRTIKSRMFRYFTLKKTHEYVHVLQKIVTAYNNSYHRSIKMTPNEACDADPKVVFKNLYGKIPKTKAKLAPGDVVRVAYDKKAFDKSYETTFSRDLGHISGINTQPLPMYLLKDSSGTSLKRRFYDAELQAL
jgi:transposase InsO family protein